MPRAAQVPLPMRVEEYRTNISHRSHHQTVRGKFDDRNGERDAPDSRSRASQSQIVERPFNSILDEATAACAAFAACGPCPRPSATAITRRSAEFHHPQRSPHSNCPVIGRVAQLISRFFISILRALTDVP